MGDRQRHRRNDAEPRSGRLSRRSRQPACAVHLGGERGEGVGERGRRRMHRANGADVASTRAQPRADRGGAPEQALSGASTARAPIMGRPRTFESALMKGSGRRGLGLQASAARPNYRVRFLRFQGVTARLASHSRRSAAFLITLSLCAVINQPAPRLATLEERAPAAGRNRSNADPIGFRRLARIEAHRQIVGGQDWRVAHDLAFPAQLGIVSTIASGVGRDRRWADESMIKTGARPAPARRRLAQEFKRRAARDLRAKGR